MQLLKIAVVTALLPACMKTQHGPPSSSRHLEEDQLTQISLVSRHIDLLDLLCIISGLIQLLHAAALQLLAKNGAAGVPLEIQDAIVCLLGHQKQVPFRSPTTEA